MEGVEVEVDLEADQRQPPAPQLGMNELLIGAAINNLNAVPEVVAQMN